MAFQDSQIGFLRKRKRYTVWELGAIAGVDINEGGSTDYTHKILRAGTEAPASAPSSYIEEVQDAADADLGFTGLRVATADETRMAFSLPFDLDPNHDIGFRVLFANDTAGNITPALTYAIDKPGATLTVAASVNTALNTAIALKASVVHAFNWTARGIITAASLSLSRDEVEDGPVFRGLITWTIATATEVTMMALELDYAAARCDDGPANNPPLEHNL